MDFEELKEHENNILEQYKKELEQFQSEYEIQKGKENNEKILRRLEYKINQRKVWIQSLSNQISFLRPSDTKDIEYREKQYNSFTQRLQEILPEDSLLRFHGTTIYCTKSILESGEISSSVDRLGYETSYDVEDQVSVTARDSLAVTVEGYTDLARVRGNYGYNMPAGCIFVLIPKDEEEAKISASHAMMMGNVFFKEEPERLYGIITTPENIEMVKSWCEKAGVDINKVFDYEAFLEHEREISQSSKDNLQAQQNKNDLLKNIKIQTPMILEASQQVSNDQKALEHDKDEHDTYGE